MREICSQLLPFGNRFGFGSSLHMARFKRRKASLAGPGRERLPFYVGRAVGIERTSAGSSEEIADLYAGDEVAVFDYVMRPVLIARFEQTK
jgi:hypothetical protein